VLRSNSKVNVFHRGFLACDRYANGLEAIARVQCPLLFVLGSQDQMTTPKAAHELGGTLKATTHWLDCGHTLMAERPDAMLAALRASLA
jgi:pimeloyl-ACP methyl ester carboxylesterase